MKVGDERREIRGKRCDKAKFVILLTTQKVTINALKDQKTNSWLTIYGLGLVNDKWEPKFFLELALTINDF